MVSSISMTTHAYMSTDNSYYNKKKVVFMKTEDTLYSGGNGTGLTFYIKKSEEYSDENPILIAKGFDENGNSFEQKINPKEVNPKNATIVEMRALENWSGAKKKDGFSSLPYGTGNLGLNDKSNFIDKFDNTIQQQKILSQFGNQKFYEDSKNFYSQFVKTNAKSAIPDNAENISLTNFLWDKITKAYNNDIEKYLKAEIFA